MLQGTLKAHVTGLEKNKQKNVPLFTQRLSPGKRKKKNVFSSPTRDSWKGVVFFWSCNHTHVPLIPISLSQHLLHPPPPTPHQTHFPIWHVRKKRKKRTTTLTALFVFFCFCFLCRCCSFDFFIISHLVTQSCVLFLYTKPPHARSSVACSVGSVVVLFQWKATR